MQGSLFNNLLILLMLSIGISAICQRIKLPTVIGYILVGVLVGPFAIGIVPESENIKLLAEFGIIFLMFTVGLEFSFLYLMKLKKDVFGYGALQVIFSLIITLAIGKLIGMTATQAIIIGSIVAMSSTAIVMKQLTEQLELNSHYSQHAIGILLFQDLAVIPILILLPSLATSDTASLFTHISTSLFNGGIVILAIILIGRKLLRPLFYNITGVYSLEIFTLTTLLIALGTAWLTSFFGLSLALGAFLAGMMLGETEFRHQIKADIRPFKDVLIGFFFITIGMQFNTTIFLTAWPWILLLVFALFFFKIVLIALLGLYFTQSKATAIQTGIILAQGSEFSFAILIEALSHHLIPVDYGQVIMGALLLSMGIAPIMIKYHQKIADLFFSKFPELDETEKNQLSKASVRLKDHIILCGFGRVGQNIASFLTKGELEFIALDLDPTRVKNARLAGVNVYYADASHYQILHAAKISRARALISTFINPHAASQIIEHVRKHNQRIPIIVRSHDDVDTNRFYKKGATEVIPETLEASLMMASHILLLMKIPPNKVYGWINESRHNRYDLLRMVFPGQEALIIEGDDYGDYALNVVALPENAFAVGKALKDVPLFFPSVKVTTVRRGGQRTISPPPSFKFQEYDIVVLYGKLLEIEEAEKILLFGKR